MNVSNAGTKVLRSFLLLHLFIVIFLPLAFAGTFPAFGPKVFTRASGAPVTETTYFNIKSPGIYNMHIYNGGFDSEYSPVSSAVINLNGTTIFNSSDFNQKVTHLQKQVTVSGYNELQVDLRSSPASAVTIIIEGADEIPPVTTIISPVAGSFLNTASITVTGNAYDSTSWVRAVTVNGINATIAGDTYSATGVQITEGTNTIVVTATDAAGNTSSSEITVYKDTTPPAITVTSPINGGTTAANTVTVAGTINDNTARVTINGINALVANSTFTANGIPLAVGSNILTIIATDLIGNSSTLTISIIRQSVSDVPPDPATVAPPVDKTVATTIGSATAFLYSGNDPIQTGVAAGTIEAKRAAVLRGKVTANDGTTLSGVKITVLNHPEYGSTLSRDDGMFDMAVNGGGWLTVNYEKTGHLPSQRQVNAPWQDYVWLPEVVLIPFDTKSTVVNLNSNTIQVAQGSTITDADGTRKSTLIFTPGTGATMKLPNNTWLSISNFTVRATEYTVGENGPKAMPGPLPPTSGYTYAAEYSIDEAIMRGATYVTFSKPVISYVENFLNFPVGGIVPAGWYDREKGVWIPSDNGKIIKILSINNGMVEIDAEGSNLPATPSTLASLGITDEERQTLATLYQQGQSLWRVPISHFTPWDCNWPYGPPEGAVSPALPDAKPDTSIDDPCTTSGSIIECQNQTLGETVNITGTPFTLNYRSDRVPGRMAARTIKIPLSGLTIPPSLKRIVLEISVAGQNFSQTFPAAPNQTYTFEWDGKDAYGRILQGSQAANIKIGYVYGAVYYQPSALGQAFAGVSGIPLSGNRARGEIILWQEQKTSIGVSWDAKAQGLGSWTLNMQHAYDPVGQIIYLGDGTRRSAQDIGKIITTVAGNGNGGFSGDGNLATNAQLFDPTGVAVDGEGNIIISDTDNYRIRKVSPYGIIDTIAGNFWGYAGDGGPATNARLLGPFGVAVDSIGNIYIADTGNHRIRKINSDGIITTVAGNGIWGFSGDGSNANNAQINSPTGIAVDEIGNIYIADAFNDRIRKVSATGIITTLAGNGSQGFSGDGGAASNAQLNHPLGVAVDSRGNIFIADTYNNRIRKVSQDGIITTVAGNGTHGFNGDGIPAANSSLMNPIGVAVDRTGKIIIADYLNRRIRMVNTNGIISTVAGTGNYAYALNGNYAYGGDNGPATSMNAQLAPPYSVAIDASGNIIIADALNMRIRKVGPPMPGFSDQDIVIPSEDAKEVYGFDPYGKHLRTVDSSTGAIIYSLTYDTSGFLISLADREGNITKIERDLSGNPLAIIAPGGQRTNLSMDTNGYLATITNPNSEAINLGYTSGGLLTTLTDPKGNVHTFSYDELGLLIKDEDPTGGFKSLSRSVTESGRSNIVTLATAEGRTTTYITEDLFTGASKRTITDPNGLTTTTNIGIDGTSTTATQDGMLMTTTDGPDPRFGMQSPITTSMTIKTPSDLTYSLGEDRTVSLSDQNNPLSIVTMTDTKAVNGKIYTNRYDAVLKKITATTPLGRQMFTLLDDKGRVAQEQTAGFEAIKYQYDAQGKLTTIIQGTRTFSISYDTLNQISSVANEAGRTVSFVYDLAGRVTQQTLPDSRVIAYSYDANGNVTSITPPGRPAHNFTFDPRDLETYYNPPDIEIGTVSTQYAYNLDKQLTSIIRPDGQTISLNYDNGGRLSTMVLPSGQLTYSYNTTTGNLSSVAAPGETLSYSFDGSLLTGQSWSGVVAGSVGFGYNNDFRITSESLNGANSVSYIYDNDGLLMGAGSLSISRYSQNGLITGSTLGSVTDSFTYSTFGEPSRYTAAVIGSTLLDVQYTRDNLGRITSKTETVSGVTSTYAYTYDQAGRLTDVTKNGVNVGHYDYDTNGNRVGWAAPTSSGVATYDNQDRLVSYGSATYTYTANGELLSKTNGGQTTSFNYDVLGNLKSATLTDGTAIEYVVDGQNRRIGKKVNGALVQGFLYSNQLRPIAELDGSGNIVSRFVYGDKPNMPEYLVRGGVTYRIITDHLGSPRLVVNASTGQIAQQIEYNEFGEVINDTNQGFIPFGFAGGLYDRDTKLVRFGARDYDAQIGRWLSKDALLFEGGDTNLFQYTLADPINGTDPDGLFLRPAINWIKKNLQFDPPNKAFLEHGRGRVCGIRYKKHTTLLRVDYDAYPGTKGQPRLHGHTDLLPGVHIPLDPRGLSNE